ncbi:MAG: hypothetical protein ACE37J_14020 [Pikeienuella sp.]|uniref:hypothetical protein n=1 Tax=Pikeienuella sp. TaxID=2831957 RepID=UPI00391D1B11
MTDPADPLDHFLAAKAAAVAALGQLERCIRDDERLVLLPAFGELTDTVREFAQETSRLTEAVAEFKSGRSGDAA